MTGPACMTCLVECPKAGRDELPDDKDCYEGPLDSSEALAIECQRTSAEIVTARWDHYVVLIGPLTDYPCQYLRCVRAFCAVAAELIYRGFVPLNPAADLLEILCGDQDTAVNSVRQRSLAMIRLAHLAEKRSALVLGTHNRAGLLSKGSVAEIALCEELGIPLLYSIEELCRSQGGAP